ncbi:MAG: imidazolonepropionase [Chloroflexi bacterium]|nr:imidazolonepropionase [Chloroflexota bacterium]
MTQRVDLLITNASQVCVVPSVNGGPQRGKALGTLGIVTDGAVAVDGGQIVEVGAAADLRLRYDAARTINADGRAVVPGFVDPHTHLAWVGDRAAEFEQRIGGATYMEIMAAGGGINSTVRAVRAASVEQLVDETRARLNRVLRNGTTTVEIKTGYGLDTVSELKLLDAIFRLAAEHPATIVPTFMGAHAVPPEYDGRTDAFVDLIVHEMTPAVAERLRSYSQETPVFVDVFCEPGAFDLAQSRRVLEAGLTHGMRAKIHADEFASIGGARLAVELSAVSADHLVTTPDADIVALGQADTVAVALPATPFGLGHTHYTPARALIGAGAALALATDCNPGTAWCESMPFVMALACRYLRITPAEALAAATLNAAYAVGLGDQVGSLEPGKQADLLILDVDDYRHLAYRFGGNLVQTVIKGGQVVASV